MAPPDRTQPRTTDRPGILHREILQLVALIVVAVGAFFLTRAIAASNHRMNLQHGVEWYAQGQRQLAEGDVDGAVSSFRRATVRNRNEKRYVLALAGALAGQGRPDLARSALLALRESAPEDADINLQLARLAARRADAPEALRYYRTTLYAPWPSGQAAARRAVRLELIRFLLDRGQTTPALAELVALGTELPNEPPAYVELGRLFNEAGDSQRALDAFEQALQQAPDDADALAGAGVSAFRTGDYLRSRTHLRAAAAAGRPVAPTLEVVELVLSADPLANRIGSAARRQRFTAMRAYVRDRLDRCLARQAVSVAPPPAELTGLQGEAALLDARLEETGALRDEDVLEQGVELAYRTVRASAARCPPETAFDRALQLIGEAHGAGVP